MDNVSHNKDGTCAFFFSVILELCIDSKLSTCPLHDCVRNVIKVVFQCYFGYEIERVPSNFGDVRVPFVVLTSMSP